MSDLNCGCGCDSCDNRISNRDGCGCGCNSGFGNNSCLWIILLLIFCGGCGSFGRSGDCGCGNDSCLWIILLLLFCGGNGCGCC